MEVATTYLLVGAWEHETTYPNTCECLCSLNTPGLGNQSSSKGLRKYKHDGKSQNNSLASQWRKLWEIGHLLEVHTTMVLLWGDLQGHAHVTTLSKIEEHVGDKFHILPQKLIGVVMILTLTM